MKTILFQGDSITDCDRLRNPQDKGFHHFIQQFSSKKPLGNGYPSIISRHFTADVGNFDLNFINRGISGNKVTDIYARIRKDIINLKPDYLSILVGVNDVWHGLDSDEGTTSEKFEKIYDMLLEEIKNELPETKVMILEPFLLEGIATMNTKREPERYIKFRSGVLEKAEITKRLSEKHGIKFVPLQYRFDEIEKDRTLLYSSDGVHPSYKGHEIIAEEWLKAYNEIV